MKIHRRDFIKGSLSLVLAGQWGQSRGQLRGQLGGEEFFSGPTTTPLESHGHSYLDLPAGFSCRVLESAGERMSDSWRVPGLPDGMGAFPGPEGTVILLRNHEIDLGDWKKGPYGRENPGHRPHRYDPRAFGGVTRLVLDGHSFQRVSSNLVLEGTVRNCAGGHSPWGWLSCEETVEEHHGYVFLCPITASEARSPQRLDCYGRFNHEAATVDPQTHVAYLTEDREDGCFYRFRPFHFAKPFVGELQALVIPRWPKALTTSLLQVGEEVEVEWTTLPDPIPKRDTLRLQASIKGAASFARGEGISLDHGQVYFTCTSGGPVKGGQIFRYTPLGEDKGKLLLLGQSNHRSQLDMPDNLTLSPWGSVFLAEDGLAPAHIRVLAAEGQVRTFARNSRSSSELSGLCFSPDGRALFVNVQNEGLTLCIQGPFESWHSREKILATTHQALMMNA